MIEETTQKAIKPANNNESFSKRKYQTTFKNDITLQWLELG
jgi:hypothetical protein